MAEIVQIWMHIVKLVEVEEDKWDNQIWSSQILVEPLEWVIDCEGEISCDPDSDDCLLPHLDKVLHEGETNEHDEEAHFDAMPRCRNDEGDGHRNNLHLATRLASIHKAKHDIVFEPVVHLDIPSCYAVNPT